jgi:hypothetical protein
MKLALATRSIIRIDALDRTRRHRGGPDSNILLRLNLT